MANFTLVGPALKERFLISLLILSLIPPTLNAIFTLQLNPGDSVMDVRQFLLDAPETCFFTCYDLLLHAKDGAVHHLEDYNEISEVADITTGDCSLEMVAGNNSLKYSRKFDKQLIFYVQISCWESGKDVRQDN